MFPIERSDMPDIKAHIDKAEHNRKFLETICQYVERFADWVAVVAFYSALHYVEALFFRFQPSGQKHGTSHEMRERLLKSQRRFKKVARHYWHLWQAATIARYLQNGKGQLYTTFTDYMSPDNVVDRLIKHHFRRLRESVGKLLSSGRGA